MQKSITEQIEEAKSQMCDDYCIYPKQPIPEGKTDNWLFEDDSPCVNCPLNNL